MTAIEFDLPIKTVGGLNAREHWRQRTRRVKAEREAARMAASSAARALGLPCIVTMTRLSAGEMDDDNLPGACKAIRDGIADAFGVDDRNNPRLQWRYGQERVKRGTFGVRVRVERA